MSDAKRQYKQYITLDLKFDEPQAPDSVWRTLYTNGIAVKSGGQDGYSHQNFNRVQTKKIIRISSPLSVNTVDLRYITDETKKVLDAILPDMWSSEKITLEDDIQSNRVFEPDYFAVKADSLVGSNMKSWWNTDDSDWIDDIKYLNQEFGFNANINIYDFKVSPSVDGAGYVESLQFKMFLRTSNQKLFNANEAELNTYVLGNILKACLAVGTYQHAFSCAGEIEVEKSVSCARFNKNDVVITDAELDTVMAQAVAEALRDEEE
tara:strand:+ start:4252 stop:5043 length:792 start_codon:yes stop_codon:yes gene_type:complete